MILTNPYVQTLLLVEGILLFLGLVALLASLRIGLDFDPRQTTPYQYTLNKKSYLVATIIMFILLLKLPLFFFFIWVIDGLSLHVLGAMCGAGIVSATPWGVWMFFVKILTLFLLCAWVLLHRVDLSEPTYPFTRKKFLLFQGLFFVLVVEFLLELAHFLNIPTDAPVACCSVLFDQSTNTSVWYENSVLLGLFFGLYGLLGLLYYLRRPILYGIVALAWMGATLQALIRFFSPYVYELPTHKCPFCLLQSEYYFIGYLLYLLLFLGLLGGVFTLVGALLQRPVKKFWYTLSFTCNTLLVLILSAYPLGYYLRNGVWL
ncbi:MAG: hypothetical protein IBX45_02360 [Campylobacterales bacterium]|nr:hypothetical protein [Campylobacterales bacterium]